MTSKSSVQSQLIALTNKLDIPSVAALVASGGKLNLTGADGVTPFHIACSQASWHRGPQWLKEMLALGADPKLPDSTGCSPLLHLVRSITEGTPRSCYPSVAEAASILLAAGADPNAPDKQRHTPLCHCVQRNVPEVAEVLLKGGANVSLPEQSGLPLEHAVASGNCNVIELLLVHGATIDGVTVERRPLLEYIVLFSKGSVFELLFTKDLITDINAALTSGETLLFHSAGDMTQRLLSAGADPRRRDQKGRTALQGSAMHSLAAFKALIAAGADVNNQDQTGMTVLHQVCGHNVNAMCTRRDGSQQLPFVQALLDAGANPTLRTNDGKLPIDLARMIKNFPVVKLLETFKGTERLA